MTVFERKLEIQIKKSHVFWRWGHLEFFHKVKIAIVFQKNIRASIQNMRNSLKLIDIWNSGSSLKRKVSF